MLWEAEAYRFLNGDEGFYIPNYKPYYYPYYYPYYSPYNSQVLNQLYHGGSDLRPYWANPLGTI
jgi:hypothetical protein